MPLLASVLRSMLPSGTRVVVSGAAVRGVMGKSVEDLYAEQPHLRTVVDFIAQNVAGLPLKCYIRRSDSDRERDTTGALPLLLRNPNPVMTGYDLIYQTLMEWCLYGRATWLVGRSSSSESGWEIRLIPTAWITSKDGSDGFSYDQLSFRPTDGAASTVSVPTSQCVMFCSYKPGEPANALSPVESLRQTLAEQMEAQEFRRGVWANAARITGYIARPAGVDWTEAGATRFREDIKNNWGRGGSRSGGTPVLEDGMTYQPVEYNAREKDWAAGVQLSREDVAAAYHINPSVIWPGSGQTYASAKDNARSLYADTLMPLLTMIAQRVNKDLLPMIGAPAAEYVEFDIRAKLQGSFEEQASALQSAVGGPWMSREEARGLMNMPAEPAGDLIVPLNVLVGGLASPNDTAPKSGYVMEPWQPAEKGHDPACGCPSCESLKSGEAPDGLKASGHPADEDVSAYESALRAFYRRQRKSVLSRIGAKSAPARKDGEPAWWDAERWDRELAEDLMDSIMAGSERAAKSALEALGIDPALYDVPRTRNFLLALARSRAAQINAVTLAQLEAAVDGEVGEDAEGSTPEGVFDKAEGSRAAQQAQSLATAIAGWSVLEASRQCAPSTAMKTWNTTSSSPRASHRRMDGETVPIDSKFSNGADWPGDSTALPVEDVANCRCEVTVTIPD